MAAALRLAKHLLRRAPSPPRQKQSPIASHILDNALKYEEENLAWYTPEKFYPVRIWEIFNEKYQVIGKLGYGAYSTVWLCRDLINHKYVSVKVSESNSSQAARELEVYNRLKSVTTSHAGARCVRTLLDTFEIKRVTGAHICLVHKPLGLRLSDFQSLCPSGKLPQVILKLTLKHILLALDYLHTECRLIHTDIQAKNILLGIEDETVLTDFEEAEKNDPTPCKVDGDRIIYTSRELRVKGSVGRPVLCDFGEARFGGGFEDIQPYLYRAPEVILDIPWDFKVDIWNLGVMIWDLSQNKHLFNARDVSNECSSERHLAEMVALIGLPPKSFLQRSKTTTKFFDIDGNWKSAVEIPLISLEEVEESLDGADKTLFLQFIRKMLRWVPEERISAVELLEDPWLNSKDE